MRTTEDEFDRLDAFMKAFGQSAAARGREELTEEQKALLKELAAGSLGTEARTKLVPLLAKNEVAMEYLAQVTG